MSITKKCKLLLLILLFMTDFQKADAKIRSIAYSFQMIPEFIFKNHWKCRPVAGNNFQDNSLPSKITRLPVWKNHTLPGF